MPLHILTIDTSTSIQSVAVQSGSGSIFQRTIQARRGHTPSLLTSIDQVLREADLSVLELDLVVVGLGPGSFTGLRIGLAAVKALWLATRCPVVGLSSLAAMANGLGAEERRAIVTATDARKGEVYAALFKRTDTGSLTTMIEPAAFEPEALVRVLEEIDRPLVGVGNGFELLQARCPERMPIVGLEVMDREFWWPHGRALAQLGHRRYLEEGQADVHRLEPHYIRLSDAELNWRKRHLDNAKA